MEYLAKMKPSDLAMRIAVEMEIHAALSTTTAAKAAAIDAILADMFSDNAISKALACWPPNGQPYVARDVMRDALKAVLS